MHWSPASPSQRSRRQRNVYWVAQTTRAIQRMSLVLKNDPAAELVSDSRYRPSASCRPTRRSRTVPEVLPTTMRSPRRTSCFGRGDDDIAVAIDRIELVAVDLDRERGAVDDAGRVEAAPGAAHRLAVLVEAALGREPRQRHHRDRLAGRAAASQLAALEGRAFAGARVRRSDCTKLEKLSPVTVRILATDSVEGQRGRPSRVMRLLGLKAVGSRPARRAKPDADRPCLAASRSIPRHTSACCSMGTRPGPYVGLSRAIHRTALDAVVQHFTPPNLSNQGRTSVAHRPDAPSLERQCTPIKPENIQRRGIGRSNDIGGCSDQSTGFAVALLANRRRFGQIAAELL